MKPISTYTIERISEYGLETWYLYLFLSDNTVESFQFMSERAAINKLYSELNKRRQAA